MILKNKEDDDGNTANESSFKKDAVKEDDTELIAVIAAAVALSTGMDILSFRVKSIARVPETSPVWARAGRQEQIYSRL